ncbi:hypothetical protein VTH06DRAFT_5950 [Thermothelomyces fergusii]
MSKQSHIERTAHEPRDIALHTLTITRITQVSPSVRIVRLAIPQDDHVTFLPGQWVDFYPPPEAGVAKPGGFTITSPPSAAVPRAKHAPDPDPDPDPDRSHDPNHPLPPPLDHPDDEDEDAKEEEEDDDDENGGYMELAVQHSAHNAASAYLFRARGRLLGQRVRVRVGGSFVFPPALPPAPLASLRRAVFAAAAAAAGGGRWADLEVEVLYSAREPRGGEGEEAGVPDSGAVSGSSILFLERVARLLRSGRVKGRLRLFLTGSASAAGGGHETERQGVVRCNGGADLVPFLRRRMTVGDVQEAVGADKEAAVVYICGVPRMTDDFVEALVSPEGFGMHRERVLFEKWW